MPDDFFDLRSGERRTFASMTQGELVGLVFFLKLHNASRKWVDLNGVASVKRACAELRSRTTPRGRLAACLNALDPPPCACGRVGLFIVGSLTFCRKCKEKGIGLRGTRYRQSSGEERGRAIGDAKRSRDYRDLDTRNLKAAARKFKP